MASSYMLAAAPASPPRVRAFEHDRLAFWLLLLFIFSIPWEEQVTLVPGAAVSRAFGAIAAGAGILQSTIWGFRKLHPLHYLICAFVGWSCVTISWSIAPELTFVRLATYAQFCVMVWLIWQFVHNERRVELAVAAFVLGSYVSSIATIVAFVNGSAETGENARFAAAGSNENELGIMLSLSVVMSCYLISRRAKGAPLWWIHLPLCTTAVLLTGSRGAFIGLLVAFSMLPVCIARLSGKKKIAGLSAAAIMLLCAALAVPPETWARLGTIGSEIERGSFTNRKFIWAAGLEAFRDHPFGGLGSGAYPAGVVDKIGVFYVAHNTYVSVLVESGIIGAILFAVLLAGCFYVAGACPRLERTTWRVLLVTWGVGVFSATWEHRKPTWIMFGLIAASAASAASASVSRLPQAAHPVGNPLLDRSGGAGH